MRLPSRNCVFLLLSFVLTAFAVAEEHKIVSALLPHTHSATATATPLAPQFLGLYASDGYFKSADQQAKSLTPIEERAPRVKGRSAYVPPFVNLHSSETVIEDLAPPARP